jgi:DNA-nicking Smr family endonuclease
VHNDIGMLHTESGLTRSNEVTEILRMSVPFWVVAAFLIIAITGCEKNSGEAVVLAKEHIDAALPTAETPNAQAVSSPNEELRSMRDDEIAVDGYVMKPEERGTSRDPRALKHDQWIVKVRMLDNGRTFQVPADPAKWEKLRENDRVKVRYRKGKYTGTVWAAELE